MGDTQKQQETALTAVGSSTNELTNSAFAALARTDFAHMVNEELDGLNIKPQRIKIPSGGALSYEFPGEGDETETVREFKAVILYSQSMNAYYRDKYTGGSNPPDCGSHDGKIGAGDPGGICKNCPYNQFGSGEDGKGKACRNKRRLYLLREGELFPLLLTLPTGSLDALGKYAGLLLSKRGKKPSEVVTKIALKKATNAKGVVYSQATFARDRDLTPDEMALLRPLCEQAKVYANNVVGFDAAEISEDGEILE